MGRAYATETTNVGWIVPVAVQFIPVIAIAIMVPFCHESPRWLIVHGQKDKAQRALDKIRPQRDVINGFTQAEVEALHTAVVEGNAQEQGTWLDLFRGNYFRRSMIGAW
jgi:SP family sugar:H+ symporter-like MFS transporter